MIPKAERDADRAICEAATPLPWEQMYAANNAGMPLADFRIPAHNGGATVEMLADDAAFIVTARNRLPLYIADADEMERRIAAVKARAQEYAASEERADRQHGAGMREALKILRGKE